MLVFVLFSWLLIRLRGDVDFIPTLLLFSPRWLVLAPIVLLAVLAGLIKQHRLWILHAITLVVVLGPLMDVNLPIGRSVASARPTDVEFGVLTINRGKLPLDPFTFRRLLDRENIRVVFFQEDALNRSILEGLPLKEWTYNKDRTLATRFAIVRELDFPDRWEHEYPVWPTRLSRVVLRTPEGIEFNAASAYMPSMTPGFDRLARGLDFLGLIQAPESPIRPELAHLPRRGVAGFMRQLAWRRKQFRFLLAGLEEFRALPLLVGGDLNTPADSRMLDPLRRSFHFAFEDAGFGYGYTRPSQTPWTRIDHLFAGPEWTFTSCRVGPDVHSDHLPLFAHVVLRSPNAPR